MAAIETRPKANLHALSNQWRDRPDDQRFLTLEDLHRSVSLRKERSEEETGAVAKNISILPIKDPQDPKGQITMVIPPPFNNAPVTFTNYSFGQFCSIIGVPASYMRTIEAPLAEACLTRNLMYTDKHSKLLVVPPEKGYNYDPELEPTDEVTSHWGQARAITSPTYGRIWDQQVVEAVMEMNGDGRWKVPAASYQNANPLRATTLYASDRDCFMFLCDPAHPVDVAGEHLLRGFMVWNSEVGNATFGLRTFLYRTVCDNRIVWDATTVDHLVIRHTSGGPERFAQQAVQALKGYANGSTLRLEEQIRTAKVTKIAKTRDDVVDFLRKRGLGLDQAKVSAELAEREEGDPTNLWSAVQGVTAYARSMAHTDSRVDLEMKAGNILTQGTH